jgi:hypothetical protein
VSGSEKDERGGGILSDEMGMGKSLSILSLVARTLDSSAAWTGEDHALADHPNPKRRMRATLIVVSSARKLNFIFKDEITSTVLINEWINEMKL